MNNNDYRNIVNGITANKNLEASIGSYIESNIDAARIDYRKEQKKRIRNGILLVLASAVIIIFGVLILLNSLYPQTPIGTVKRYIYEIENNVYDAAEQYVSQDYGRQHKFFNHESFSFKFIYNDTRNPDNRKESTVDVWIEYLDEEVEQYIFLVEKTDGRWKIVGRYIGNSELTLSKGIQIYTPDENAPKNIHVDFFYSNTHEELVEMSDVIAIARVERLEHIYITSTQKYVEENVSMYGKLRILDKFYSTDDTMKNEELLDVWIFYDPRFENIIAPDMEEGGEYIVFLKRIRGDMPSEWDFFDYSLLSDYVKYKVDVTKKNVTKIKQLISDIKE